MLFKYNMHHFPSGKTIQGEGKFMTEEDFLRHINDWNRLGAGKYLYWSAVHIVPKGPAEIFNKASLQTDGLTPNEN